MGSASHYAAPQAHTPAGWAISQPKLLKYAPRFQ